MLKDQLRSLKNILNGLSDIGINPDEPPVRQSERSELYQKTVEKIIDSGNAYYCNCSKRLDQMSCSAV